MRVKIGASWSLSRRCRPRDRREALHCLGQLRVHFVRDGHDIRQKQAEIQPTGVLMQGSKHRHLVEASYLYSDGDGSHFLYQESYETVTLNGQMVGDALDFLIEGASIELRRFNGNPIGLELPVFVELDVAYTEPAVRGDSSGGGTKAARLETGLEIRVPLFIKEGEKVKVSTENREFAGRA
jgi:Elongation factor P, C-terminal/Elongation factor P (EF-P) OB domain